MGLPRSHAMDLITASCESHGGMSQWLSTETICGSFTSLGGSIPRLKGLGFSFTAPGAFSVHPHKQRVVFGDYPTVGDRVAFQGAAGGASMTLTPATGEQTSYPKYRQRFRGVRKWRLWGPLDAAYFFGYALLTYYSVPFILSRCEIVGVHPARVTVRFPDEFETHCQAQSFWFDSKHLLTRQDYTADVLGSVFRGAHHSNDFVEVNGLTLARSRQVCVRLGRVSLPLVVLSATLSFRDQAQTSLS